jgi:cell division protein FtsB
MEQMQKEKAEFAAKLEQAQKESEKLNENNERLKNFPYLSNLNQDPTMSGKVKVAMKQGDNIVGK